MFTCLFYDSDDQTEMNGRIKQKQAQLKQFEASRKDKMKRYGENIPDLLKRINEVNNRGSFKEMPRGPIGEYNMYFHLPFVTFEDIQKSYESNSEPAAKSLWKLIRHFGIVNFQVHS